MAILTYVHGIFDSLKNAIQHGDILVGNNDATPRLIRDSNINFDGTDLGLGSGNRFRMQSQNRIRYLNSMASVTHNAAQSINDTTVTVLAFNTENFDTDAIHDTVTNNSRLTCKLTGKYFIGGVVYWDPNITGFRQIFIKLNGTTILASQIVAPSPAGQTQQVVGLLQSLTATDYVELYVQQGSGGALNVTSGSGSPTFYMYYVGE